MFPSWSGSASAASWSACSWCRRAVALLGDGAKLPCLARDRHVARRGRYFLLDRDVDFVHALFPNGFGDALPQLWSFDLPDYPFPFVLVTAFAALNGLFLYLMRAPTALGRPIMDQLAGFRLYLETAEADRLNMQGRPRSPPNASRRCCPMRSRSTWKSRGRMPSPQALRRAHPGDADPMRNYQPGWSSGGGWSGGNFSSAVASSVAGVSGAFASAVPASSGSSGFGGGGGWRLGRRRRRRRRRRLVARDPEKWEPVFG